MGSVSLATMNMGIVSQEMGTKARARGRRQERGMISHRENIL